MENHIKSFITSLKEDETLIGWGLNIVNFYYDNEDKIAILVAKPELTEKSKSVLQEYLKWLVKEKDLIIEEIKTDNENKLLAEFNWLFLEDNYEEILRNAEMYLLTRWLIYSIEKGVDVFDKITFAYSIDTENSKVIDEELFSKIRELLNKGGK